MRDIFGTQDDVQAWRTHVHELLVSNAFHNLPPGVASDKDVQLALGGVPNTFANVEHLRRFIRGIEKLVNYKKRYNTEYAGYIEANKTGAGFEAPDYKPEGADQATIGVTTSTSTATEPDFDFSKDT